ncbi:unnamed protein product [Arabidopsis lyrata]|nr:unnamed protein product [Arabidopsis lyrata]
MANPSFDAMEKSVEKLNEDTYRRLSAIEVALDNLTMMFAVKAPLKIPNPRVIFDLAIGGYPIGRLVMARDGVLCRYNSNNGGELPCPLHRRYHSRERNGRRIDLQWHIDDENFIKKHTHPGIVSISNRGPNISVPDPHDGHAAARR